MSYDSLSFTVLYMANITAPRVAAVQSERRPGRPALRGKSDSTFSSEKLQDFCEQEVRIRGIVLESLNNLKKSLEEDKEDRNLEGRLDPDTFEDLPLSLLHPHLQTSFPPPSPNSSQYVCETSSRLLFLSVHWAKQTGGVFRNLLYPTQVSLMKNSWYSLFLLSLAQCRELVNLPAILKAIASTLRHDLEQNRRDLARTNQLTMTLSKISSVVSRIQSLNCKAEEFVYMKLCCLFSPGIAEEIICRIVFIFHILQTRVLKICKKQQNLWLTVSWQVLRGFTRIIRLTLAGLPSSCFSCPPSPACSLTSWRSCSSLAWWTMSRLTV